MKASELIEMLRKGIEEHGDLDVMGVLDDDPSPNGYHLSPDQKYIKMNDPTTVRQMMVLGRTAVTMKDRGPEREEAESLMEDIVGNDMMCMTGDGLEREYIEGGWPMSRPLMTMSIEELRARHAEIDGGYANINTLDVSSWEGSGGGDCPIEYVDGHKDIMPDEDVARLMKAISERDFEIFMAILDQYGVGVLTTADGTMGREFWWKRQMAGTEG